MRHDRGIQHSDSNLHGEPPDLTAESERPLGPAMLRGWRGHCPNCGGRPIFGKYLQIRDACPACGEELHHHRADDLPAWLTILVVGHVLAVSLLTVETLFMPPMWTHWALWPALTLGLTLWLLPRIKGAVVAMQWSWRMHGFGEHDRPGPTG